MRFAKLVLATSQRAALRREGDELAGALPLLSRQRASPQSHVPDAELSVGDPSRTFPTHNPVLVTMVFGSGTSSAAPEPKVSMFSLEGWNSGAKDEAKSGTASNALFDSVANITTNVQKQGKKLGARMG